MGCGSPAPPPQPDNSGNSLWQRHDAMYETTQSQAIAWFWDLQGHPERQYLLWIHFTSKIVLPLNKTHELLCVFYFSNSNLSSQSLSNCNWEVYTFGSKTDISQGPGETSQSWVHGVLQDQLLTRFTVGGVPWHDAMENLIEQQCLRNIQGGWKVARSLEGTDEDQSWHVRSANGMT